MASPSTRLAPESNVNPLPTAGYDPDPLLHLLLHGLVSSLNDGVGHRWLRLSLSSSLHDLHPFISLNEIDMDLAMLGVMTTDSMYLASTRTALFMQAYADPRIDTSSHEFISASEEVWSSAMADLHADYARDGPTRSTCWAMGRFHWYVNRYTA